MKIGIISKGFDGWGGGIDFIRYIVSAIEVADEKNQHEKYLLLAKNDWHFYAKKLSYPFRGLANSIRYEKTFKWQPFRGFDENYLKHTFQDFQSFTLDFPGHSYHSHLEYSRKNKFDILLPCILPPSNNFNLPWIGYLYDFQHKYFPEFFTEREIARRDHAFTQMLQQADHVIVNANAVKQDAEKFVSDIRAKIHVLPFSPSPMPIWLSESRDLRLHYAIEKPYFIISNQFWIHKDHITAFKGFAEFLEIVGKEFLLVCTGETYDFRVPEYFEKLLDLAIELGIKDDVKILGHISKIDQIALLKNSIAVIQPTLFEGGPGGGASYDAISLGKPLIISDIEVNREIDKDERVFFFKAKNAESLAYTMTKVAKTNFTTLTNQELNSRGLKCKKLCGEFLLSVIQQSVS